MIHDAEVEVTCDGEGCRESIRVRPDYTYRDWSGHSGSYDCSDEALAKKIEDEGWLVNDGKHFCGESCREVPA
jgi:hypothetical protein